MPYDTELNNSLSLAGMDIAHAHGLRVIADSDQLGTAAAVAADLPRLVQV